MQLDPKGLEQAIAAAFCTRENGNIDFDAAIATAIRAYLEAAPSPSSAPGVVEDDGLERFTAYFVKNYPGPDTIIHDPKWHAPRIFRAAKAALAQRGR